MKELLTGLLAWIALQIGGEPPAAPDVQFWPQQVLAESFYGNEPPADARLCGLYHAASRTIYLPEEWRAEVLVDRASLLHELVHHVQAVRAMPYPCAAARERLAYQLQMKWLRENGVADPYALINIDEFTIAIHSICPSPD